MKEIIAAAVLFSIMIFALVMSIRSFCEKGFLMNNAYLYASKQEREAMDKKPYYRQSAVVFLLIGCIFALNGCAVLLHIRWISYLSIAVVIGTLVYAIVSGVVIEAQKQK